ncbi:hypothetical protein [Neorhodopirellula pilleata]|uniref:Uncharacterized protein n=1 Tax=Neorhodopirellula pilleata TaxID=2714738 RepID=A0A5C5YUE5_9BACT|nr:hypothetical protein [Neorhodopirellula pilleata]TWT78604.1 hypothetical protein Pla100_62960 [Neorhodopirellula pilleata]
MHSPPGAFHRDASSRLRYEIDSIDQIEYPEYASRIAQHFGLRPACELIAGPGEMFCDYTDGTNEIEVAWDTWSGLFATAKSEASETLVRSIAVYLGYTPSDQADGG